MNNAFLLFDERTHAFMFIEIMSLADPTEIHSALMLSSINHKTKVQKIGS